jgi:FkbM family methyltransferase
LATSWKTRLDRLGEIAFLAGHHAAGPAGVAALLRCYGLIVGAALNPAPVDLPTRVGRQRRLLRMRACDIYTVAEIFRERQYALARPLGPAPVIIDAGANIGVASAWFVLRHPDARVLAVEPVAENFAWLQRNFGGDPGVELVHAALGARSGRAMMALAGNSAEHTLVSGGGEGGDEAVDTRRLDELLAERGIDQVDLLKLDVEGSELDVLLGLGDRLASVRAIVAEVHERLVDVAAFYRLLAQHGFTVVRRVQYREAAASGVHTMEAWRA